MPKSLQSARETRLSCVYLGAWAAFVALNAGKVGVFRLLLVGDALTWQSLLPCAASAGACLLVITAAIFCSGRRFLLPVFYLLQLLYLSGNLIYYQIFGNYLYLDEITHFIPSLFSVAKAGAFSFNGWETAFLVDLPFLLALVLLRPPAVRCSDPRKWAVIGGGTLILVLVGACQFPAARGDAGETAETGDAQAREEQYIRRHGILLFTLHDGFRNGGGRGLRLVAGDRSLRVTPAHPRRNLYLIQVESMDAGIVEHRFHHWEVMPFLSKLRQESVYYPFLLSIHNGGGTSDCDFSILNSVEPQGAASVFFDASYNYPNSVLRRFHCAGFRCSSFHGNDGSSWSRDAAYPRMGYDDFWDIARMHLPRKGWGAPDGDTFNWVAARLAGNAESGPQFVHVITMSSHYPYNSVEEYYRNPVFDTCADPVVRRYFNSMNYVDACLEKLVTALRRRNDGAIVILGDHTPPRIAGNEFCASKLELDGKKLEFVPLFLVSPDVTPHTETRFAASFLDVAPTLLSLAGVPCSYATTGVDLTSLPDAPPPIRCNNRLYRRDTLASLCRYAFAKNR